MLTLTKRNSPLLPCLRAIGYTSDKDILHLFNLAGRNQGNSKKISKKQLDVNWQQRILKRWTEDFVDEDTGELVTVERNEIILERDTILDEDNIKMISEASVDNIILQREDITEDLFYNLQYTAKDPSSSEMEAVIPSIVNCGGRIHRMTILLVELLINFSSQINDTIWRSRSV